MILYLKNRATHLWEYQLPETRSQDIVWWLMLSTRNIVLLKKKRKENTEFSIGVKDGLERGFLLFPNRITLKRHLWPFSMAQKIILNSSLSWDVHEKLNLEGLQIMTGLFPERKKGKIEDTHYIRAWFLLIHSILSLSWCTRDYDREWMLIWI